MERGPRDGYYPRLRQLAERVIGVNMSAHFHIPTEISASELEWIKKQIEKV